VVDRSPRAQPCRPGRRPLRLSRGRAGRRQGHRTDLRQQREVEQSDRDRSKTYKVIKDIKTSRRPRDMHFSADRSKLYVACGDDDVIDILDVAKLEVIGRIPTGPSPETFAIDEAKRRIYVANEEGSSLSIIDMDQAITIHEVPTGAEPEGVYVAEDGKTLYVTSEVGDLIHLVDTEGGHVLQDVVVGTRHAGLRQRLTARSCGSRPSSRARSTSSIGEVRGLRQDRVPPARHAQKRRHAGGLAMTKDGKTAFVTLGHAAHVAVVDVPTARSQATSWSASAPGVSRSHATSAPCLWRTALAMTLR